MLVYSVHEQKSSVWTRPFMIPGTCQLDLPKPAELRGSLVRRYAVTQVERFNMYFGCVARL